MERGGAGGARRPGRGEALLQGAEAELLHAVDDEAPAVVHLDGLRPRPAGPAPPHEPPLRRARELRGGPEARRRQEVRGQHRRAGHRLRPGARHRARRGLLGRRPRRAAAFRRDAVALHGGRLRGLPDRGRQPLRDEGRGEPRRLRGQQGPLAEPPGDPDRRRCQPWKLGRPRPACRRELHRRGLPVLEGRGHGEHRLHRARGSGAEVPCCLARPPVRR
mmetsp:Transcript_67446/g.217783  ORF Transcript_67446/g.217783 Transcript_67446/m.217783 type:complete len:219 (-) Transcript_67446:807-1463(-)